MYWDNSGVERNIIIMMQTPEILIFIISEMMVCWLIFYGIKVQNKLRRTGATKRIRFWGGGKGCR
jgi:hypothetical protein